MCARKRYDRSFELVFDFHNENLYMVADEKLLSGYLLAFEKHRLACARINYCVTVDREVP